MDKLPAPPSTPPECTEPPPVLPGRSRLTEYMERARQSILRAIPRVAGTGSVLSSTGSSAGGGAGVWGDTTTDGVGISGTADDGIAIYATNNSGSDITTPAMVAINNSSNSAALVFLTQGNWGRCTTDASGDLSCSGTVSPSAQTAEGDQLKLYGVAFPENWFEDAGSGQLSGGSALIALDPAFASTVNTGQPYHVFLTPNGDCRGLYVASKTAAGFEVRELGGGTSNISFDYRIMAKRRGCGSVMSKDRREAPAASYRCLPALQAGAC
jgi:hypothetical protein